MIQLESHHVLEFTPVYDLGNFQKTFQQSEVSELQQHGEDKTVIHQTRRQTMGENLLVQSAQQSQG